MTDSVTPSMAGFCADERAEGLLNEYVDGEIASADEPELFGHLAACPACRETFSAFLAFRLAARAEPLAVPPAADTALFARLDRLRAQPARPDRAADRSALGGALRRRVSLGATLAVALVVLAFGLLTRPSTPPPALPTHTVLSDGALYLMDPGVTVSAPAPLHER